MPTSTSARRLTHSLGDTTSAPSGSAEASLSARLFESCQDLAKAALESDYIQGIAKGTLHPDYYGHYSVQDVGYCSKGLEDWKAVAAKATDADLKAFAEARVKSWTDYVNDTYDSWRIRDPRAVELWDVARAYSDFEGKIARQEDAIYAVVVMTPCDRLWAWLADQLASDDSPSNLYSFWIEENTGDSGARHLETVIDAHADTIDESRALRIYRRAMLGEVNFFRAACGQKPSEMDGQQ